MIIGLALMLVGTILDRSFSAPNLSDAKGWLVPKAPDIPLPALVSTKTWSLARSDDGSKKLDLRLGLDLPQSLYAELLTTLKTKDGVGDGFALELNADGKIKLKVELPALTLPLPPLTAPTLTGTSSIGILFKRTKPLIFGDAAKTHLKVGTLSGGFTLANTTPKVEFDLGDSELVLKTGDDAFLSAVIGDQITVALTFGLIADTAGGLRLKDGTGLKATIPLQKIPNSPVQIPFLTFEVTKTGDLNQISVEISGSFQVSIGPFSGSIDRLGTLLRLDDLLAGATAPKFALKPPSGAGLAIDAGIVKGGGFLLFDPDRGEYGGILDIKIAAIGVKAIGLLSTKNPGGWSLLLIITAQLPPIQLGFGFTLTGIGGLLGVQHTVSVDTLSAGLASGSLDSFLFPQDPIANAPQIINQLRTIFPFKAGGFVIGPMLELGWSTPSLVIARVGVLIEASQIVFVGQVIVQLPPLVDKSLALLRLEVDFAGGIVFDPLKIWFDGVLRDSRVVFISLTGQFAFRAIFGDKPTFLISAGGFHPKFTDIPPGIPAPFQRVGAEMSIGIVGMQFKGYFAVTSATVQGGCSMRVWADVGIASFEGGFEFDAIIYIVRSSASKSTSMSSRASTSSASTSRASTSTACSRGRAIGTSSARPRCTRRGRCPTSAFTSTRSGARTSPHRSGSSSSPPSSSSSCRRSATGRRSCRRRATPSRPSPSCPTTPACWRIRMRSCSSCRSGCRWRRSSTSSAPTASMARPRSRSTRSRSARSPRPPTRSSTTASPPVSFLKLSEDETWAKPSFDRFEAGFEVGQRDYLFGVTASDLYDYEEVNLSTPKAKSVLSMAALSSAGHASWAMAHGAAGRSDLRRPAKLKPAVERKIAVNPPPLQTIDLDAGTMTGAALGGNAAHSYWTAVDHVQASGAKLQVVEAFETIQAF